MKKIPRPRLRGRKKKNLQDASQTSVPRITNETVAETREEVLKGARKLIYPLQHSKHRVVRLSIILGVVVVLGFFTYSAVSMYQLKDTSTFTYRVSQVIPFPVAKVGSDFVLFEDYLFELRQYVHYFTTQENLDFSTGQGKEKLVEQRKAALEEVINKAYIKRLARQNNVTVSNEEISREVEQLRAQNRLGGDEAALRDVIRDYYGWTLNDFRRSLKDRILATKVLETLDTETKNKANTALAEIQSGKDFAAVAAAVSSDVSTKDKGGELPFLISPNDPNLPTQMSQQIYALKVGEVSGVFSVGYGLEIVKVLEEKDGKRRAAHILLNYRNIQDFINAEKENVSATRYLRL